MSQLHDEFRRLCLANTIKAKNFINKLDPLGEDEFSELYRGALASNVPIRKILCCFDEHCMEKFSDEELFTLSMYALIL